MAPRQVRRVVPGGKFPSRRFHLVRVTTDDRERLVCATCGARKDAITQVLNAIAEGWTAALLPN